MAMKQIALLFFFIISISINAQTKTTIAWDVSLSMKDRNLEKEFDFITTYFNRYKESQVTVLQFNNVATTKESFTITNGDWNAIKSHLRNSQYSGATSYQFLKDVQPNSTTLLFTDGKENIERDFPELQGTLYVINASENSDIENLQFLALANKGRLINLVTPNPSNLITYTGTVFSEENEATEVVISVKGTDKSVIAEKDGSYSIEAQPGDILVFSALGVAPLEKVLSEKNNLNVWVKNDGIQLNQVFIKNELEAKSTNTNLNKERDSKTIGYSVSTVTQEELNQGVTTLSDATEGKFTGVTKGTNQDIGQSLIRGMSTISGNNYPLIIIDGAPIARSYSGTSARLQLTDFIDPKNVADIKVLKGLAATNQYGSEGANGVILIKTKMEAERVKAEKSGNASKESNYYSGTPLTEVPSVVEPYLNLISKAQNIDRAYEIFQNQMSTYWNNPSYFTDLYNHFTSLNETLGRTIGYNLIERSETKLSSLRGLLFNATQNKDYQMALDIATNILERYPDQAQPYLDLALAQKNVGNAQIALNMLLSIEDGSINSNINYSPLLKSTTSEIRNIVANKPVDIDLSKIGVTHLKKPELDARIVIEWSNPNTEFELYFVNPSNRFFKWEHTNNNAERLQLERLLGFYQEEFEIEGSPKGEWLLTVKYLGNRLFEDTEPTFLKCTIQYDYGKSTERTEQKVLRLSKKGDEYLINKVIVN